MGAASGELIGGAQVDGEQPCRLPGCTMPPPGCTLPASAHLPLHGTTCTLSSAPLHPVSACAASYRLSVVPQLCGRLLHHVRLCLQAGAVRGGFHAAQHA